MTKIVVITHVNHVQNQEKYYGYAPYIREMNLWLQYVDEVTIVAPLTIRQLTPIDLDYNNSNVIFKRVPDFNLTTIKNILFSIFKFPIIFWKVFWAMYNAEHIHLRCPGNMGLVGCLVQILFPKKTKTAKYAGNWDPKSKQPWTYKLQQYILNNTFLTRNMQVLVYGEWNNQSKNIKSFFTATYSETEKGSIKKESLRNGISFVFAGGLTKGKNPLYSLIVVNHLIKKGYKVILNLFGDGIERENLQKYIAENNLEKSVFLKGNQDKETLKEAFKESHFVILPSKSEGWPKAIAEGMFWGCVPLATNVSCVSYMLGQGKRGLLLEMNLEKDVKHIEEMLENESEFFVKSQSALSWSQEYTTEVFDEEIKKLMLQ